MAFELFCGMDDTEQEFAIRKAGWKAYTFHDLNDALRQAFEMEKTPNRPWEMKRFNSSKAKNPPGVPCPVRRAVTKKKRSPIARGATAKI
jgi:hypothetical protein